MENKEYKIIIETSENNIGFQMFVGNDENDWNCQLWNQYTDEEKSKFKQMAQQFVNFLTKYNVK